MRLVNEAPAALPANARPIAASKSKAEAQRPLTITVTLSRTNEAAFEAFLAGVQDPASPNYRHFLPQAQLADRFGPSQSAYDAVLSWLRSKGFSLVQGSANRLTITVTAPRATTEKAFGIRIKDYQVAGSAVYTNDQAPTVPNSIAPYVVSITGTSNLSQPVARQTTITDYLNSLQPCLGDFVGIILPNAAPLLATGLAFGFFAVVPFIVLFAISIVAAGALAFNYLQFGYCLYKNYTPNSSGPPSLVPPDLARGARPATAKSPPRAAPAPGKKIGLLEFDTFHRSDVTNWLNLMGLDPTEASGIHEVPVNGGVPSPGPGEGEVLLDINTILDLNVNSTGASPDIAVYEAPPSTSFGTMFNAMINDGDTVISNSWSACEDQVTQADAKAIDSVLAQAAASGISVFNGAGDKGSTCLDGSPNTIGVPADSPNATAVGGTQVTWGGALNVTSQRWWDGSQLTPPTGQGGYGVSRYFSRPAYQDGFTTSASRSVPDVAVLADPSDGLQYCQADNGGCPDGHVNGGTSMSAPAMAAKTANLDQALGSNIGNFNAAVYGISQQPHVFTTPTDMASDFAHVGLGAPNFDYLYLTLKGQSVGAVSPSLSSAAAFPGVAVGTTSSPIRVQLHDANGAPVAAKSVSLTANGGSAILSASTAVTDANGDAAFAATDTVPESFTFTVTDTTDNNIRLTTKPTITFVPPPATGGQISANPTTVVNDGTTASTVTVTLKNAKGQGARGKTVTVSGGSSAAQISATGATPGVTDSNGVATFAATDQNPETVTFTATDVTDGNLPVPGSATVTYSGNPGSGCPSGHPTGENGAVVTTAVNGVPVGGIAFVPCTGAFGLAFDSSGNLFVDSQYNGNLYKLPGASGLAGPSTLLSNALGTGAYDLTFGTDGKLYGVEPKDCGAPTGTVVQLDTNTGAVVRIVTNDTLMCPTWIATDPLTGDLFVTNGGNGRFFSSDLWRIHDPSGATPTVSVYATDPSGFTQLAFAPNGTLYALNRNGQLVSFGGTNTSQPVTETVVASVGSGCCGLVLGPIGANGAPSSVYVSGGGTMFKIALPAGTATEIAAGAGNLIAMKASPDGCLYAANLDVVIKVTGADGSCDLTSTGGPAINLAESPTTAPTGSPATFTATLANVTAPAGTPIHFVVSGANTQGKLVNADANGKATFTYSGVFPGNDTVTAFAVINGKAVTSAPVAFRWVTGKDTTFLSLNRSQGGGPIAKPAKLTANLADVAQIPPSPITNASVTITLGVQSCTTTTDSSGNGSCMVTPTGPPGLVPVTASYAGTSLYTPSTANDSFAVSTATGGQPPTITSAASTTFTVGTAGSFTVVATGSPTPTLGETGPLPAGVTFNPATGMLTGTPGTGTVGGYPITFTATNGIAPDATQAFTLNVVKAATTTTVAAGPPNPALGTPVTFTAAVAPTAANTLTPTGTVSFFIDGQATPVATVALVGGRARLTTSALSAGSHTVVAVYNGDANFATSTSTTATTATVTCTNTVTGDHPGALIVSSGSVCIVGAHIGGAIVVAKGASIDIEGSTIGGGISTNGGAGTIRICDTTTTGAVSVQRSTGLVIIGDPGDAACQPNRIGGALVLQNNTGGVEAINNTVGRLVASNNSGPGPFPGDTTTITGNHA